MLLNSRRIVSGVSWFALLLVFVGAAGRAAKAPRGDGWIEVRTENFVIYASTGARQAKRIAGDLERFREVLSKVTGVFDFDVEIPTTLYVFPNDSKLKPYKLDAAGKPRNISGYFMERPFRNYVALDAAAGSNSMRVVYHEYVHSLMHATFEDIPVWLDEGIAEYYSTFKFVSSTSTAQIGHPIEGHTVFLSRNGLIPMSELFETTTRSKTYNEGARQGMFYAQSWLLVHYFAATEERRRAFGHYLGQIHAGVDADEALAEFVGSDRVGLSTKLRAYLDEGSNYYWMTLDEEIDREKGAVRELEAGEALWRLGDLLAQHGPDQAQAATVHLNEALRLEGPNSQIYTTLGFVEETRGAAATAGEYYRAAVEDEAADVEAHTRYGSFLLDQYIEQNPQIDGSATPQEILAARGQFQAALEQNPDAVEALAGLGRTYLYQVDDAADGLIALTRANRLRPDREDILHDMVCMLANSGHTKAAWSLIETRLRRRVDDPELMGTAEAWVVAVELDKVNAYLAENDPDAALATIDQALSYAQDPQVRHQLRLAQEHVEAGPQGDSPYRGAAGNAEIDAANALIVQYNSAIELAGKGQFAEALEILEELEVECQIEGICEQIHQAAGRLREVSRGNAQADRYNEAVALANSGEFAEATRILSELESEVTEPELLEQVREILRAIERR